MTIDGPRRNVAALVITDGRREHIADTIASFELNVPYGAVTERWLYDDSGDEENHRWLRSMFPTWTLVFHARGRQGFGGAIRTAWSVLQTETEADYIFHLEDDFTFNRLIPLDGMIELLDSYPNIAQVALRRQAWNPVEKAAGGVVEANPEAFLELLTMYGDRWLEHSLFFTTNPCIYRKSLFDFAWPEGEQSEGQFTMMLREAGYRFAYWGARNDAPWVHHTGLERNGTGY